AHAAERAAMMDAMKPLRTSLLQLLLQLLLLLTAFRASAAQPLEAECLVPSKPGGAMDLTCKLARTALQDQPGAPPLRLSYLPGGIGAVAWHTMESSQRRGEPNTLVAFSGGSLLNLAEGKFGNAGTD